MRHPTFLATVKRQLLPGHTDQYESEPLWISHLENAHIISKKVMKKKKKETWENLGTNGAHQTE